MALSISAQKLPDAPVEASETGLPLQEVSLYSTLRQSPGLHVVNNQHTRTTSRIQVGPATYIERKERMSMPKRSRLLAIAALTATLSGTAVVASSSASASASADDIYDCLGICNQIYDDFDMWTRTDSGYQQALANMQTHVGGYSEVAARAYCDTLGVWIQSTIWVSSNTSNSHIDCGVVWGDIYGNGIAMR